MCAAKKSSETRFGLPLTVRRNPRARRVILRLEAGRGLVLVLPPGVSRKRAEPFLEEKRAWVEQARQAMEAKGSSPLPRPVEIPDTISYRAEEREFQVHVLARPGRTTVTPNGDKLLVRCEDDAPEAVVAALRRYTARRARSVLVPWLAEVGRELNLDHAKVTIRAQKTRWGSCTTRGHVSLNAGLLFLPPDLVDQLLVHELCHLRHPDHSPRFWDLVAAHRPGWKETEKRLARARSLVPAWMH